MAVSDEKKEMDNLDCRAFTVVPGRGRTPRGRHNRETAGRCDVGEIRPPRRRTHRARRRVFRDAGRSRHRRRRDGGMGTRLRWADLVARTRNARRQRHRSPAARAGSTTAAISSCGPTTGHPPDLQTMTSTNRSCGRSGTRRDPCLTNTLPSPPKIISPAR
jgi:hypothetical protein